MYGFGFVLVKYRIALPAVVLYEKHPQYKPGFVAVMALAVINFIEFMWRAIRWRSRQAASARSGKAIANFVVFIRSTQNWSVA